MKKRNITALLAAVVYWIVLFSAAIVVLMAIITGIGVFLNG